MKILLVEVGKEPRIAEIPHTLEMMQKTVDGYIQAVFPWKDPVVLVCDEEGLITGKELNRVISPDFAIFGTFFLCGMGEEDFADISDEMAEKFTEVLAL